MPDGIDFCPQCKIIIDNGNQAKAEIDCMNASILLGHAAGMRPTPALIEKFAASAMALRDVCKEIALSYR